MFGRYTHFPHIYFTVIDPCASQDCTHRPEALTNSSRGTYPGVYFLNSRKNAQFSRVNARFPEPRLACVYAGCAAKNFQTRGRATRSGILESLHGSPLFDVPHCITFSICAISSRGRESNFFFFFFFSRVPVRSMELSTA